MYNALGQIEVYLEIGKSRTFVVALDWPGWCRSGRDEASGLQALIDYGPRYAGVLTGTRLGFHPPSTTSELVIAERLTGNATTDFGAPGLALPIDKQPVTVVGLQQWLAILDASWMAYDHVVQAAQGKILRKGPRGGGRDLGKLVEHVQNTEHAYLASLGGNAHRGLENEQGQASLVARRAILETFASATNGEIPAIGPRGGKRWSPRYFVRRFTWHVLDHTWEIEDRIKAA